MDSYCLIREFYCGHHDLVNHYGIFESQMTIYMFHLSQAQYPFLIHNLSPGLYLELYSIFRFLCSALLILVSSFVLFLLPIVLSVLRSTDSDSSNSSYNLSLFDFCMYMKCLHICFYM